MNVEDTNRDRTVKSLPEEKLDLVHETEPSGDHRPPKRGFGRFLVPALIVLALLGGVGWIVFNRVIMPMMMGGQMAPPATQVRLASPKSGTISDTSDYAATLDSRQAVTLQPRVDGQIRAIYVRAGARVRAGEPILQIDAAEQRATVASSAAAAETSAADIQTARADVTTARATLRSLEARRQSNLSTVQLAQREYERFQVLLTEGATSQQVMDQRLNALQEAQADLAQTEAEMRAQQAAITRAQATVVRNQQALKQAQATVNAGSAQLNYYTITAPFTGVVGNIPVKEGDFVSTSTQLATVAQNEALEIEIQIPLERASDLRRGMPVQLLDSEGKVLQTGQIFFIAPNVDPASQSIEVKASFNNPGGQLRTEQFARARVIWATSRGVLVPTTAISRLAGKDFIFVAMPYQNSGCEAAGQAAGGPPAQIEPNQTVAVQKEIQLGKIVGNDQEVVEGVSAKDQIVVSGILQLQNCSPIVGETQAPAPQAK
ncbi:efflux RND transporter periplasmic adaptor subunit [Leptolyngbya sp. FACHB-261]|nr:efflux RND transporter periplasmic adaptor subunit [Leptolyngbya sp. FACHB-261]